MKTVDDLFKEIENERKRWRVPLFVMGAGVSVTKVPLMNEIFKYFCELEGLPEKVKLDAQKLYNNKQYQSRATASNFFGILQTSENPNIKKAWNKFTKDFLEGRVKRNTEGLEIPLWELEPTVFHKMVAKQVVRDYLPGICLSLNYDGLTAKAIKEVAINGNKSKINMEKLELLYPCRILTTQEEIMQYYARNSKANDFYQIIKLRGDIFNAVCETEGCRYQTKRTPIYEINPTENEANNKTPNNKSNQNQLPLLGSSNQSKPRTSSRYEKVMKCSGCGNLRRVEIDFPGYRTKELETNKIIEMIYRFIVPSLSRVVICGVSGNWDYEIVEFLRVCAIERGLKIYCLDIEKPPLLQYHAPWATIGDIKGDNNGNFFRIKYDFSKFDKEIGEETYGI